MAREVSSTRDMCLYVLAMYVPPLLPAEKLTNKLIHGLRSLLYSLPFDRTFVPPLALAFKLDSGVSACDILINILLWCLGWIPGVVHAWWLIGRSGKVVRRY
ncbi:hypothetical protein JCM11491_001950 [Sporobolomyces phaffii]